jgi:DDE superfamily endonuclease
LLDACRASSPRRRPVTALCAAGYGCQLRSCAEGSSVCAKQSGNAFNGRESANGTTNLFIFLDAHRSWRKVKVTNSRAAVDFAACMRELIDVDFPEAERIRGVLDNLSTHFPGSLYQAFPPCEARRVLRRLEFHYVPKHASWLNIVEIEIGVLRRQCLDRRIATPEQLVSEIAAWERQRNASGARIKWMFTTAKARAKMGRAYPEPISAKSPSAKES